MLLALAMSLSVTHPNVFDVYIKIEYLGFCAGSIVWANYYNLKVSKDRA